MVLKGIAPDTAIYDILSIGYLNKNDAVAILDLKEDMKKRGLLK